MMQERVYKARGKRDGKLLAYIFSEVCAQRVAVYLCHGRLVTFT